MIEVFTIIGARPQFIKAAAVSKALRDGGIHETIIHTGQHYDHSMSDVFWEQLNIPKPSVNLQVGSMPHGAQTAQMMLALEELLLSSKFQYPDAMMVYGDTNSTIAGSLVAAKLNIPVIHVEAGLRSFNRAMPEEINRVVTDHVSSLLFCSSSDAVVQLKKEGITKHVHVVGDVMLDAFLMFSKMAEAGDYLAQYQPIVKGDFHLMTIHRPSNTDHAESLQEILDAVGYMNEPVIWPVHPRNKEKLKTYSLPNNLHLFGPASYFEMLSLLKSCQKVVTDSGGLQKEAYWAQKPCITVRNETEWVETLEGDWNQLTGPNKEKILEALYIDPSTKWKPLYGDGQASAKISAVISEYFS